MLILVRHGRTAANAARRMQGRVDNPLDEVGREQALAVARHLHDVDRVVSSPLRRAVETAEAIGAPLTVDDRWLELDFGAYDDRFIGDVPPEAWEGWSTDDGYRAPGGESMGDVRRRVAEALDELREESVSSDIVIVSHVSPIKAGLAWALGLDNASSWRTHLDVASVTRIASRDGTPLLVSFNEIGHLAPAEHRVWGIS